MRKLTKDEHKRADAIHSLADKIVEMIRDDPAIGNAADAILLLSAVCGMCVDGCFQDMGDEQQHRMMLKIAASIIDISDITFGKKKPVQGHA